MLVVASDNIYLTARRCICKRRTRIGLEDGELGWCAAAGGLGDMERSREVEVSMHIMLDIQPIDGEVAAYQGLGLD